MLDEQAEYKIAEDMYTLEQRQTSEIYVPGFTDEVFGQHHLSVVEHDAGTQIDLNLQLGQQGIEILPPDQYFTDGEFEPAARRD